MNEAVKDRALEKLKSLWVEHYKGKIDMEDNWITEGRRLITWEIKSPRKTDKWVFSIPLALPFGASIRCSPMPIAQHIAQVLSENTESGWQFVAENGYVNAYFTPRSLKDYLGERRLNKEDLLLTDEGAYALYRLQMIEKSLRIKGTVPATQQTPMTSYMIEQFGPIFDLPQSGEALKKWASSVSKLTSEGRLIGLTEPDKALLLGFLEQALESNI